MSAIPRLLPHFSLPPYSYVPDGPHPHPVRDGAGHHFGRDVLLSPLEPGRWRECIPYLLGIDLFNHGYYWEAHEAWEQLWHLHGRRGPTADFLKGLIQLAAAGVKVRQGVLPGVLSHAQRAAELLRQTSAKLSHSYGLDTAELSRWAMELTERRPGQDDTARLLVTVVFPFFLLPQD